MQTTEMSPDEILTALRERGVWRVHKVEFTNSRSSWIRLKGSTLRLQRGLRHTTPEMLEALARVITRNREASRDAITFLKSYPPLLAEMLGESAEAVADKPAGALSKAQAARFKRTGSATAAQEAFLQRLYERANRLRFGGRLPHDLPLRLSNRMKQRMGHASFMKGPNGPIVLEIALNEDLLLEGNEAILLDTLLHEMAHVEALIFHNDQGHGLHWMRCARAAGAKPVACGREKVHRAPPRMRVDRIPDLDSLLPDPARQPETEREASFPEARRNFGKNLSLF